VGAHKNTSQARKLARGANFLHGGGVIFGGALGKQPRSILQTKSRKNIGQNKGILVN